MDIQELVGRTVWMKCGEFKSIPGQIKSVAAAVRQDDNQLCIEQSIFNIEMTSGEVREVAGRELCRI
jgi:hypothetical protein